MPSPATPPKSFFGVFFAKIGAANAVARFHAEYVFSQNKIKTTANSSQLKFILNIFAHISLYIKRKPDHLSNTKHYALVGSTTNISQAVNYISNHSLSMQERRSDKLNRRLIKKTISITNSFSL